MSAAITSCRWLRSARVLYVHTPDGFGRSKLVERLHQFIGSEMTARNYRSVRAIRALV